MPRLTLSRKICFALATLLVVLLLMSAAFSIFALQRGLRPYVAEIEIRRMGLAGAAAAEAQRGQRQLGQAALAAAALSHDWIRSVYGVGFAFEAPLD